MHFSAIATLWYLILTIFNSGADNAIFGAIWDKFAWYLVSITKILELHILIVPFEINLVGNINTKASKKYFILHFFGENKVKFKVLSVTDILV